LEALTKPSVEALESIELPGPTGESNRLYLYPRGVILCLGPSAKDAQMQATMARLHGCSALLVAPGVTGEFTIDGFLARSALAQVRGFDGVALWSDFQDLRNARLALAGREGIIIPLLSNYDMRLGCSIERHVCIDTTAAGGNATLLAENA